MISRNHGFVNLAACTAICVALWIVSSVPFVAAQSSWQAEWDKTLRAAEAEGQFTLYGCCYDYDRVLEVFRKRHPKIKANIVVAVAGNSLSGQVAYNLKQANPGEFKSYWDLLQPKWKGKTVSLDPTAFGMGATLQFFYYHPDLGPPFIKKLYGDTQITVSRDPHQMTDWLSAGKFSLCIRCNAGSEVGKAMQHKLPIGYLDAEDWKEGGSSSAAGGTLGIPTRAPHPNAAKVFVNWLLSREGQLALQKFGRPDAHNSRRIDIPKDEVDPYNRLEEGKKYFDLARPEYQDLTPIFKLVKEVLPQK